MYSANPRYSDNRRRRRSSMSSWVGVHIIQNTILRFMLLTVINFILALKRWKLSYILNAIIYGRMLWFHESHTATAARREIRATSDKPLESSLQASVFFLQVFFSDWV